MFSTLHISTVIQQSVYTLFQLAFDPQYCRVTGMYRTNYLVGGQALVLLRQKIPSSSCCLDGVPQILAGTLIHEKLDMPDQHWGLNELSKAIGGMHNVPPCRCFVFTLVRIILIKSGPTSDDPTSTAPECSAFPMDRDFSNSLAHVITDGAGSIAQAVNKHPLTCDALHFHCAVRYTVNVVHLHYCISTALTMRMYIHSYSHGFAL